MAILAALIFFPPLSPSAQLINRPCLLLLLPPNLLLSLLREKEDEEEEEEKEEEEKGASQTICDLTQRWRKRERKIENSKRRTTGFP